jgi:DNA adenine methylase
MDPPYWETEGYGVGFPWEEYVAMAELMRTMKGKAILSINDHPDIRACFEGFYIEEVPIKYTVGGGQGVDRMELIISSWDVAADPVGLF